MEIHHSRRHCSVCQQIYMVFSNEDKILIKAHKYTQNTQDTRVQELKSVHLMCTLFAFSSISGIIANLCRKFEFLISQGSAATRLR